MHPNLKLKKKKTHKKNHCKLALPRKPHDESQQNRASGFQGKCFQKRLNEGEQHRRWAKEMFQELKVPFESNEM